MKKILSGDSIKEEPNEKEHRKVKVARAYEKFLEALGYDWKNDSNMQDTPRRVAKMYVDEITNGAYNKPPKITSFPNREEYKGMVIEKNIDIKSLCSHHMMPFIGKCHVAYIPGESVIGLSKINRIVEYYSRRPQLQEQLTTQIHDYLKKLMPDNLGIMVYIEANHTCVSLRGVNQDSSMITATPSGAFKELHSTRAEFYSSVKR